MICIMNEKKTERKGWKGGKKEGSYQNLGNNSKRNLS